MPVTFTNLVGVHGAAAGAYQRANGRTFLTTSEAANGRTA